MTVEQLRINIEELEALLNSGNDFDEVEKKARVLLIFVSEINDKIQEKEKKIIEIKVKILLILSESLRRRGYYNEAMELAEDTLLLLKNMNNPKLEMKVYNNIGNVCTAVNSYDKAISFFKKAHSIAIKSNDKFNESVCFSNLGIVYMELSDYKTAIDCFSQSLSLDEQLKRTKGIGACHVNLGVVYWKMSDYGNALSHYQKALGINKELQRKASIANILSNMGVVYYSLTDYKNSLECHTQSLKIYEELGVKNGIARNLGNIANIYTGVENYDKAIEYCEKSLIIYEEIGKKDAVALVLSNIGEIYFEVYQYDISLEYCNKALQIYEELQIKDGIARVLGNMGNIYRKLSNFEEAIDCYIKALSIDSDIACDEGIVADLGNLGVVYADTNFNKYSFQTSEEYLQRALIRAVECGTKDHEYKLHKSLAELYKHEKEWEKYSYHIEQYHSLEKEVQSLEVKKQADRFDLLRQIMEKEKARAIAERDGEIQRLKAEELARNIALMKKELEELIERLVRKSQFIRSISGKLEYAMSLTNGESRRAVYSVIELLDERVGDEEDRIVVLLQLRAVYGAFMSRLESVYKELNDEEIKTCALMMMQLSTSKIAITLGVSERTIEKYRSTIRKKLGIAAHGNIVSFLQQFLEE